MYKPLGTVIAGCAGVYGPGFGLQLGLLGFLAGFTAVMYDRDAVTTTIRWQELANGGGR